MRKKQTNFYLLKVEYMTPFQLQKWYDELYLKWFDVGLSPLEAKVLKAIEKRLGK